MKPDEPLTASDLKLTWGNAARAKAEHREEARQRHLARPLSERLLEALALMQQPRHDAAKR
jgi:hypothetical protein